MTKARLWQRQRSGLVQWPALGLSEHRSRWSEGCPLFISQQNISARRGGVWLTTCTEKLLIQGELGRLHRIVTHKRVMSSALMYVNQEKTNVRLDSGAEFESHVIFFSFFFFFYPSPVHFMCLPQKITKHLPDPACENSFRLNLMNLILRRNDNNNTQTNDCTM